MQTEEAQAAASRTGKADYDGRDVRMLGRGEPVAPPKLRPYGNTGPKGVKKDFEEAKQNLAISKVFEKMRFHRSINQTALGARSFHLKDAADAGSAAGAGAGTAPASAAALVAAAAAAASASRNAGGGSFYEDPAAEAMRQQDERELLRQQQRRDAGLHEDSDNAEAAAEKEAAGTGDESEDLFGDADRELEAKAFDKFKRERIAAVQASLPSFGAYARVDTLQELADLVNTNHELVSLVVHVYQNRVVPCIGLHLVLEALAPIFPHVCFVRVRSDEAMKGYSDDGLPTLLIYRGSELKESLIGLAGRLGVTPSDGKVAQLLADHGVLRIPTGGVEAMVRARAKEWIGDRGYDGEGGGEGEHGRAGGGKGGKRGVRKGGFATGVVETGCDEGDGDALDGGDAGDVEDEG